MKIFFRVDSSITIGSGHITRCLTLAKALRSRRANVAFICRDLSGHFGTLVKKSGFKTYYIRGRKTLKSDISATQNMLLREEDRPDWLIVDNYGLGAQWESALRPFTKRIMVIDDLIERPHQADALLNQNNIPKIKTRYKKLLSPECVTWLGPQYALLREEFRLARRKVLCRRGLMDKIFVSFGGVDLTDETLKVVRALKIWRRNCDCQITVVLGKGYPYRKSLTKEINGMRNIYIVQDSFKIAPLMAKSDIAIGAGGTTAWERCTLGLPSLIISVADNQVAIAQGLARSGAAVYLGESKDVTLGTISKCLEFYKRHPHRLRLLSRAAYHLCDGDGVNRVASALYKL